MTILGQVAKSNSVYIFILCGIVIELDLSWIQPTLPPSAMGLLKKTASNVLLLQFIIHQCNTGFQVLSGLSRLLLLRKEEVCSLNQKILSVPYFKFC